MSAALRTGGVAVALAAAGALGFAWGRGAAEPAGRAVAVTQPATRDDTRPAGVSPGELRAAVRDAVRDELRAAAPAAAAAPAEVAAAPVAPAVTQAEHDALALVAQARVAGRWAEADVAALSPLLATLDGAQRAEVFRVLADAVNRGEIRLEARPVL